MFNLFRKKNTGNNPFALDWGVVTPEQYSKEKNDAVYVLNFDFHVEESRNLAKTFTIGRILWYHKHLPKNCSHNITLDLRGQDEIKFELEIHDQWRADVLQTVKRNIPGVKIEMTIII